MIIIYKLIAPDNKEYIGQTGDLRRRLKQLRWEGEKSKSIRKVAESIRNHGFDNFKVEIVFTCPDEDADKYEKFYIYYFNSIEKGLNEQKGGHGTKHLKEETKMRLRELNKGNKNARGKRSEGAKERIKGAIKRHYQIKKLLEN
jgi:group I intron endonuclease